MPKTPCSNHLLFTGKTHYSTVRNNIVHGGGYGILSKHDTYLYTYNNIMANQTNFYGWVSRSGHNTSFFNNTIYCNPYNSTVEPTCIQFKNDNSPARNVTNVTIYDNIIYMYNASPAYKATENGINFTNINMTSWNNTFYMNASNPAFAQENSKTYNLTAFLDSFGSLLGTLDVESTFSVTDSIPTIFSNSNTTATTSTIDISWNTQESSNSTVAYGTSPTALSSSVESSKYNLTHRIYLTGLSVGTDYYYNITSCDTDENCNISETFNFTTLAEGAGGSSGGGSSSGKTYYERDSTENGTNLVWSGIRRNDKIKFNYDNQEHEIKIKSITSTNSKVEISSEPQELLLDYGIWRKVDLDQNGGMDVELKVEEEFYRISVYLEKLSTEYFPSDPIEEISEEELVEEEQITEETQEKIKITSWLLLAPLFILGVLIVAIALFFIIKEKKKKVKKRTKKQYKKRKRKKK